VQLARSVDRVKLFFREEQDNRGFVLRRGLKNLGVGAVPRKQFFFGDYSGTTFAAVLLLAFAAGAASALVLVLVKRGFCSTGCPAAATTTTTCRGTASAAAASSLCRQGLRDNAKQRKCADGKGSTE
jgi:hypothetical protein